MTDTLFIRLLHHEDKGEALAERVAALREGRADGDIYAVMPESFRQVPNTPFCYWVGRSTMALWGQYPSISDSGFSVNHGMATKQDFRFLRLWFEISSRHVGRNQAWVPYAKGGEYSQYYADIHLLVDWREDGRLIHEYLLNQYPYLGGNTDWVLHPECNYYDAALTYIRRTQKGFSARILPKGCRFDKNGPAITCTDDELLLVALLGVINSKFFSELLNLVVAFGSYEIGILSHIPIPITRIREISQNGILVERARTAWAKQWSMDRTNELSHAFTVPALLQTEGGTLAELRRIQDEIDEIAFDLYSFMEDERKIAISGHGSVVRDEDLVDEAPDNEETDFDTSSTDTPPLITDHRPLITDLLSWCASVAFGRFDIRLALDPGLIPAAPDLFDPLPVCPPGMLVGPDGLPASPGRIVSEEWLRARPDANTLPAAGAVKNPTIPDSDYPLRISWDGVLVDDPGFNGGQPHRDDIVRRVREVLDLLWKDKAYEIEQEACEILGVSDLRDYFRKPAKFFQDHLKRYSKSRRKAPIYWPISTASGSYTLWLYYHRLTDQTLYAAVNKYVEPKISEVERGLARIEDELKSASGRDATRLRDRLNENRTFLGELRDLREELLRIAGLPYKPNLNDGVIINAAPLHNLFRLRTWANDTKKVWVKLEKGDYDWAHLAYTIWPERVRGVCKKDRSIAIAHGLEDICKVEAPAPKKKGGRGRRKKEAAR